MTPTSAAVSVSYVVTPWGLDNQANLAANDLPLPARISEVYPVVDGKQWDAGSQIVLAFGPLATADLLRLMALNGTTGTLTAIYKWTWIRCTGSFTFANTILTFTLSQPIFVFPDEILDPYL